MASGIPLNPGDCYRFVASGCWKDAWKTIGPSGWKLWPLQRFNRLPNVAFLCLCGSPGENLSLAFAIGDGREWTVPPEVSPGTELMFFANDWQHRYGNNHPLPPGQGGPLRARVTRLA
ncbi:MAG: hypothetical protein HZB40_11670 [Rhodocyclales bacterium]|nr:hypothetical protein [Rhodocyclales bacterium]